MGQIESEGRRSIQGSSDTLGGSPAYLTRRAASVLIPLGVAGTLALAANRLAAIPEDERIRLEADKVFLQLQTVGEKVTLLNGGVNVDRGLDQANGPDKRLFNSLRFATGNYTRISCPLIVSVSEANALGISDEKNYLAYLSLSTGRLKYYPFDIHAREYMSAVNGSPLLALKTDGIISSVKPGRHQTNGLYIPPQVNCKIDGQKDEVILANTY